MYYIYATIAINKRGNVKGLRHKRETYAATANITADPSSKFLHEEFV